MKNDSHKLFTTAQATSEEPPLTRTGLRSVEAVERPTVLDHGERRVLFGPGLDDFNAFDDPC